jgi:hypothetical protein
MAIGDSYPGADSDHSQVNISNLELVVVTRLRRRFYARTVLRRPSSENTQKTTRPTHLSSGDRRLQSIVS